MKLLNIYNFLFEKNLMANAPSLSDSFVLDITYDSREVKAGTLFFCKGKAFKKEYLEQALKDGAVDYVSEVDYEIPGKGIIVTDVRKAMIELASFFFDYPDRKLVTIGVTGTKGKTTTVKFLKSIFDQYLGKTGRKACGLISSINTYDGLENKEAKLTTPEAIPLYRHLHNAVEAGLEYMIIEASSQAFKYDRVTTVEFDLGVFLNIGEDHVSDMEHPDFDDYLNSKLMLVDQSKEFIVNSKTDHKDRVFGKIHDKGLKYETFSLEDQADSIYARNIVHEDTHATFEAVLGSESYVFHINEPGDYNIENALAAILIARHFGIDFESIYDGLDNAEVEGRNKVLVSDDKNLIIWVSYAHNGLSFEKTFETLRNIYGDIKIISLFGAPGDKAKSRLIDMSRIGAENSDYIIIGPDDPGSKPFEVVANEMIKIIKPFGVPYESYPVREDGIKRAFDLVDGRTLLFLAGKGEDTYDFVQGQYIEFESDLSVAQRLLAEYNKKH